MKPHINNSEFGLITIDNRQYDHDVLIKLDGSIYKRRKKLSKAVYGTSHIISIEEARFIFEKKAELLIIGTGQYDQLRLSDGATDYLKRKKCRIYRGPTPQAIKMWNASDIKKKIGLFHVTC